MGKLLLATPGGTSGFPILLEIVDIGGPADLLLGIPILFPAVPILLYDLDSEVCPGGSTIGVLLEICRAFCWGWKHQIKLK